MSRAPDPVLLAALAADFGGILATGQLSRWIPSFRYHGLVSMASQAAGKRGLVEPELLAAASIQEASIRLHLDVARQLATRFAEEHIPLIFIKGVALASTVYSPPGLRAFGDIDILVAQADLDRATRALESSGFERNSPASKGMERDFARTEGPGVTVWVDLHWDLTGEESLQAPIRMPVLEILERARIVGGLPLPTDEDSLLIAASNLIRSCLDRLVMIADFGLLCARPLDWNVVRSRAEAWGLRTSLWIGLTLAKEHLSANPPMELLTSWRPGPWKRLMMKRLLQPDRLCRTGKEGDLRYRHLLKALCIDSWGDVARMLAAIPRRMVRQAR